MTEKKLREQHAFTFSQQGEQEGPAQQTKKKPVPQRAHRPAESLQQEPPVDQPVQQPASPQYAGHNAGMHDESMPYFSGDLSKQTAIRFTTRQQTTGQQRVYSDYDIDDPGNTYPSQVPSSAVRWQTGAQRSVRQGTNQFYLHNKPRSAYGQKQTQAGNYAAQDNDEYEEEEDDVQRKEERKLRRTNRIAKFVLIFAILCFIMLLGYILIGDVGTWIQTKRDDLQYGMPRTYQTDEVVGINDSAASPSHFIAINLNGRVTIIFLPGGDATKAVIFNGPYIVGDQGNLTPITLSFKDVTGNGRLDMLVHDGDKVFYYIQDKSTFRPQKPGEQITP